MKYIANKNEWLAFSALSGFSHVEMARYLAEPPTHAGFMNFSQAVNNESVNVYGHSTSLDIQSLPGFSIDKPWAGYLGDNLVIGCETAVRRICGETAQKARWKESRSTEWDCYAPCWYPGHPDKTEKTMYILKD